MSDIAVVGLGYVGLPLAVEFGKIYETIGFDLSKEKIGTYKRFMDPSGETTSEELRAAKKLIFTTAPSLLKKADYIIVVVPTPVDEAHKPDFGALISASRSAGQFMKKGVVFIYE